MDFRCVIDVRMATINFTKNFLHLIFVVFGERTPALNCRPIRSNVEEPATQPRRFGSCSLVGSSKPARAFVLEQKQRNVKLDKVNFRTKG